MNFLEKLREQQKKMTVKAFKDGEQADQLGRKAAKIDKKKDKTKDEESQARELRKEAEQFREQQEAAKRLTQNMGIGEKILRCYFTYKMASLLCHTLVGLTGNYYDRDRAIGHAVANGIDRAADRLTDNIMEQTQDEGQDINEERARMIEQTLESFEHMSGEAEKQGLTKEGEPLLSDEDRERLQDLAKISRDSENEQQADLYAAKCQELGLDYNEARTAFEQDKSLEAVQNEVDKQREKEANNVELEYSV